MFENVPDYIKEVVIKASENNISKERFELYQKELKLIADIKKQYYKSKTKE